MKNLFLGLLVISFGVVSCKKDTTVDPTPAPLPAAPLTITKADFATNFKPNGTGVTNANVNLSASSLAIPTSGDNQTWDVSGSTYLASYPVGPFVTPPVNASFASATYALNNTNKFGFGPLSSAGTPSVEYYEVSDAGWFYQGYSTSSSDVLNIPSIGGSLTYAPQNIVFTNGQKFPQINLPISFNSKTTTSNIIANTSFIANAPAAGVNNIPGQVRTTDSVINNIVASGTINLKGIGKVRVLVNSQTDYSKTNYFLGGAPAPTALLTQLGLVDGAVTVYNSYDFYAEGLGRVGRIYTNASGTAITTAFFRVQ